MTSQTLPLCLLIKGSKRNARGTHQRGLSFNIVYYCYSVIKPYGYWTSGTLSALASNGNTLYNVMGVKRHIMPVDLPEGESISGAEINLTVCAVSNGVPCCNLPESESVLKMCISKDCREVTGFLSWIRTYCISCVVQQRNSVKDSSFLEGYGES